MRKTLSFFAALFLCSLIIASSVVAQTDPPRTIFGGVVNGKAISLPFPEYDENARRSNLSGTVIVDVTIDENGVVVAAKAAVDVRTGSDAEKALVPVAHPVLREAAEKAAFQAKFPPTLLSGKPIRIAGTIVYNIPAGGKSATKGTSSSTAIVGSAASVSNGPGVYQGAVQSGPAGVPKQISGGVLNGKAVSLPKPPYPPAARAVNAEGAVSVQVLIDEEGNVVSANAVSGHPLLRAASVEAARAAKFSPTRLMDQPVKVSGIITYNFVGSFTPGMLGYEIGYAERAGMFAEYSVANSLAARLPENWAVEKEMLESLTYETPPVVKTVTAEKAASPPDGNRFTVMGASSGGIYTPKKLTPESIESLRRLQSEVETRLSGEDTKQWHFKLGKGLGAFVAEIEDDNRLRINLAEIEQLAVNKPAATSSATLTRLNEFIELAKTAEPGTEGRKALVAAAQGLRNLRISQW
jgi:TonB family protein